MSSRRSALAPALLVVLIAALLVLPPLGRRTIATPDEARFMLLARDMVQRHVWFNAQVHDEIYRNKPPLYPWSIAALSIARGRLTEATAQAPVAIAAIIAALATFLLGGVLFGRRAGLWSALVLITSYGFFQHSQMLLPDMLVVAFGTTALYAFWKSVVEPPGRRALTVFYAALALAVFSKGPMGLFPLAIVLVWIATEHGASGLRRLAVPEGMLLFTIITAAWLVPYVVGSGSFTGSVVGQDWLGWYLGGPSPARLVSSLLDAVMGFMPWTLLLPLAFGQLRRDWTNSARRFAVLMFVVPLVIVLLSHNQRTRYLLPVYPGLALVVAAWADARGAIATRATRVLAWLVPLAALVVAAAAALPRIDASLPAPPHGIAWIIAGALLVGATMSAGLVSRRPGLLVTGVGGIMLVMLGGGVWVYNPWVNAKNDFKGLAVRVEHYAQGGEPGAYGSRFLPLEYYLGRSLRRLQTLEEVTEYASRPDRPVVVMNGRSWRTIERDAGSLTPLDTIHVRGDLVLIVRARGN